MFRSKYLRRPFFATAALAAAFAMFTPAAQAMDEGKIFLTQGLVCDRPSFVDAVITLADGGDNLRDALAQINAGSERPRCKAGTLMVARYISTSRSFFIKDSIVHVHKVKIIGVAQTTAKGIVPKRLQRPMTQYVFSMDKAVSA